MIWLPIDDAAKSGDDVLLYSPDAASPYIFIGHFAEWGDGTECWTDSWTAQEIDAWPTHYMLLPEAPFEIAKAA